MHHRALSSTSIDADDPPCLRIPHIPAPWRAACAPQDPEVAALKQQQAGMQQQAAAAQRQQQEAAQQKEMETSILSQILEPAAFERLQRLKIVRGEKVQRVIDNLVGRAKSGQLREQITDAALVEILGDAGASERNVTVTMQRKRNAFDEDEEEADDY